MKIDWKTKLYCLIGSQVEETLSPAIHNAAFESLKINAVYLAFNVPIKGLTESINGLKTLGVSGFNVTMPHKISVMPLLDEVEPNVKMIGAVNTVKVENRKLIGYNTDGDGALDALKYSDVNIENKKVVIIGAGGAARTLSYTFASLTRELVILNRTRIKALRLSEEVSKHFKTKTKGFQLRDITLLHELNDADLVINASAIGMYPNINDTPIDSKFLSSSMTVFDIVYKPLQTKLLKEAKAKGAKTIDGLKMLVYQALRAQKIWIGEIVKPKIMFQAALRELKSHERIR